MQRLARKLGKLIGCCAACWVLGVSTGAAEPVTVFAAASLREALEAVGEAYEAQTRNETRMVFAASSAVARQVAAGAPADVVLLADREWADWLVDHGHLQVAQPFAGNVLLVVGRGRAPLEAASELPEALGDSVLAMAQVDAVPAGRYGKQALEALDLWDVLTGRVVQADNVRAALRFVERGEAALGIGYASDLTALPNLAEVYRIMPNFHAPIIYAGGATTPEGVAFMDFLLAPVAQNILSDWGFEPVDAHD